MMAKEAAKNYAARSEFLLCLINLLCFFFIFSFSNSFVVVVVVLELSSNVTTQNNS